MKYYDDDVWDSLTENKDKTFNRGYGYFIKPNVSDDIRQKLRKIQDEELDVGQSYWILDFLAEDFELDPNCIEFRDPQYFRKYKPKPKDDVSESE